MNLLEEQQCVKADTLTPLLREEGLGVVNIPRKKSSLSEQINPSWPPLSKGRDERLLCGLLLYAPSL